MLNFKLFKAVVTRAELENAALHNHQGLVAARFKSPTFTRLNYDILTASDQVEVQVELELPAASADAARTLHPELQFGERVQVFGSALTANWSSVSGKVARTASYYGTLYADLVATASLYAATELEKLTDALTARQAALDAAG